MIEILQQIFRETFRLFWPTWHINTETYDTAFESASIELGCCTGNAIESHYFPIVIIHQSLLVVCSWDFKTNSTLIGVISCKKSRTRLLKGLYYINKLVWWKFVEWMRYSEQQSESLSLMKIVWAQLYTLYHPKICRYVHTAVFLFQILGSR